ncbi:MAG: fumarylacetoacetate hydrolase family protein [Pirellulales bacterium]
MKIARYQDTSGQVILAQVVESSLQPLSTSDSFPTLFSILDADSPEQVVQSLVDSNAGLIPLSEAKLLAPIDQQEVWAAGVTYKRSKTARMEESEAAADCYDRVYASDRPELFFKAMAHRVSGMGAPVRIRYDATWNVPEPELTLVLNSKKQLVGFTIGNDMSSRDIEGENPLYLPQAKVYDQCCGLGPWITLKSAMDAECPEMTDIKISLEVKRAGEVVFSGNTDLGQLARTFEDLIGYLGRDNSFPHGAFLLTGTGIVPDNDFTLLAGDVVDIHAAGIGTLSNPVVQG